VHRLGLRVVSVIVPIYFLGYGCSWHDSKFNHVQNMDGKCVLAEGTVLLPDDNSCRDSARYWYDCTPYRCIPHLSCEDGERPDCGRRHLCPGVSGHRFFFWVFIPIVSFAFTMLVATWYYRRSGHATGTNCLPGDGRPKFGASNAGVIETLTSVHWVSSSSIPSPVNTGHCLIYTACWICAYHVLKLCLSVVFACFVRP
jgi:hypothetical protein